MAARQNNQLEEVSGYLTEILGPLEESEAANAVPRLVHTVQGRQVPTHLKHVSTSFLRQLNALRRESQGPTLTCAFLARPGTGKSHMVSSLVACRPFSDESAIALSTAGTAGVTKFPVFYGMAADAKTRHIKVSVSWLPGVDRARKQALFPAGSQELQIGDDAGLEDVCRLVRAWVEDLSDTGPEHTDRICGLMKAVQSLRVDLPHIPDLDKFKRLRLTLLDTPGLFDAALLPRGTDSADLQKMKDARAAAMTSCLEESHVIFCSALRNPLDRPIIKFLTTHGVFSRAASPPQLVMLGNYKPGGHSSEEAEREFAREYDDTNGPSRAIRTARNALRQQLNIDIPVDEEVPSAAAGAASAATEGHSQDGQVDARDTSSDIEDLSCDPDVVHEIAREMRSTYLGGLDADAWVARTRNVLSLARQRRCLELARTCLRQCAHVLTDLKRFVFLKSVHEGKLQERLNKEIELTLKSKAARFEYDSDGLRRSSMHKDLRTQLQGYLQEAHNKAVRNVINFADSRDEDARDSRAVRTHDEDASIDSQLPLQQVFVPDLDQVCSVFRPLIRLVTLLRTHCRKCTISVAEALVKMKKRNYLSSPAGQSLVRFCKTLLDKEKKAEHWEDQHLQELKGHLADLLRTAVLLRTQIRREEVERKLGVIVRREREFWDSELQQVFLEKLERHSDDRSPAEYLRLQTGLADFDALSRYREDLARMERIIQDYMQERVREEGLHDISLDDSLPAPALYTSAQSCHLPKAPQSPNPVVDINALERLKALKKGNSRLNPYKKRLLPSSDIFTKVAPDHENALINMLEEGARRSELSFRSWNPVDKRTMQNKHGESQVLPSIVVTWRVEHGEPLLDVEISKTASSKIESYVRKVVEARSRRDGDRMQHLWPIMVSSTPRDTLGHLTWNCNLWAQQFVAQARTAPKPPVDNVCSSSAAASSNEVGVSTAESCSDYPQRDIEVEDGWLHCVSSLVLVFVQSCDLHRYPPATDDMLYVVLDCPEAPKRKWGIGRVRKVMMMLAERLQIPRMYVVDDDILQILEWDGRYAVRRHREANAVPVRALRFLDQVMSTSTFLPEDRQGRLEDFRKLKLEQKFEVSGRGMTAKDLLRKISKKVPDDDEMADQLVESLESIFNPSQEPAAVAVDQPDLVFSYLRKVANHGTPWLAELAAPLECLVDRFRQFMSAHSARVGQVATLQATQEPNGRITMTRTTKDSLLRLQALQPTTHYVSTMRYQIVLYNMSVLGRIHPVPDSAMKDLPLDNTIRREQERSSSKHEHTTPVAIKRSKLGYCGSDAAHIRYLLLNGVGGITVYHFLHTTHDSSDATRSVVADSHLSAVTGSGASVGPANVPSAGDDYFPVGDDATHAMGFPRSSPNATAASVETIADVGLTTCASAAAIGSIVGSQRERTASSLTRVPGGNSSSSKTEASRIFETPSPASACSAASAVQLAIPFKKRRTNGDEPPK